MTPGFKVQGWPQAATGRAWSEAGTGRDTHQAPSDTHNKAAASVAVRGSCSYGTAAMPVSTGISAISAATRDGPSKSTARR